MFRTLCPQAKSKTFGLSNGVDTNFFSPECNTQSPYEKEAKVLVFTGAMDYWANCDAVIWFANEVFPELKRRDHHYEFYIVGSNPTVQVQALDSISGIVVTGRVDDVRPYCSKQGVIGKLCTVVGESKPGKSNDLTISFNDGLLREIYRKLDNST